MGEKRDRRSPKPVEPLAFAHNKGKVNRATPATMKITTPTPSMTRPPPRLDVLLPTPPKKRTVVKRTVSSTYLSAVRLAALAEANLSSETRASCRAWFVSSRAYSGMAKGEGG